MHPKDLSIEDFTYDLPQERIAKYPAHPRDTSKLLIYNQGQISQDIYRNMAMHLDPNSVLIFNDTKVIKSRILFTKDTGAIIEVFCLEPYGNFSDFEHLFEQQSQVLWKCMIGKASKWKEKSLTKVIEVSGEKVVLKADLVEKLIDSYVVKLSWTPEHFSVKEVLDAAGTTPLPPYIKRKATKEDEQDYQTTYSAHEGSVAAPTAGLHFTDEMMTAFHEKGIKTLFTTLHVGAGTFKPVKSETMEGHIMHKEWMNITTAFLESLLENIRERTIISVGTTATRTLESIYWMGNKILNQPAIDTEDLIVGQWEPYENSVKHDVEACVSALLNHIQKSGHNHLLIETGIIIAPGYDYKVIKGLVTNFHQPKSTLLLLVDAFMGEEWHRMYDYAMRHEFRFLSYGDGCLIFPKEK